MWMSHSDKVTKLPQGWTTIAKTENAPHAAVAGKEGEHMYGLQFHPEVQHSVKGTQLLENFSVNICGAPQMWKMEVCGDV